MLGRWLDRSNPIIGAWPVKLADGTGSH